MRATFVTLAAVAALVAACNKKPADAAAADAAGKGAAATAAAPAGPGAVITLAEMPAPKAGLWKGKSSQDGEAPTDSSKCLDGKPINPLEGLDSQCAKTEARRTATGGFTFDGDCPANGVSMKVHMGGEGDFQTTFTTDAQMTMQSGTEAPVTMRNKTVWTYAGADCKAG